MAGILRRFPHAPHRGTCRHTHPCPQYWGRASPPLFLCGEKCAEMHLLPLEVPTHQMPGRAPFWHILALVMWKERVRSKWSLTFHTASGGWGCWCCFYQGEARHGVLTAVAIEGCLRLSDTA